MTEIVKSTSMVDSKPVWVVKGAIITYIDEEKSGVSTRTGSPWRLRNINVRVDNGEGSPSDYMRITLRGDVCQRFKERNLMVGSTIDLEIHFNISNGRFQNQDIIGLNII